VLAFLPR